MKCNSLALTVLRLILLIKLLLSFIKPLRQRMNLNNSDNQHELHVAVHSGEHTKLKTSMAPSMQCDMIHFTAVLVFSFILTISFLFAILL